MKQYLMAFIQSYGEFGIFFCLVFEFLALPIPNELLMAFLGYLNWKQDGLSFYVSIASASAGTFTSYMLAYSLGRKYGEGIIRKFGKLLHAGGDKLEASKDMLQKHKILLLVFCRFIPGVRHLIPYIAGMSKLSLGFYAPYNLLGSVLWTSSFIGLGYALGEKWALVERVAKAYSLIIIALAVFIYIVYKYFNKHKIAIITITLPLLLFIKLSENLIKKELSIFDDTIYSFVSRLISKDMTALMKFFSFMGSGKVLVTIALVSLALFWKNRRLFYYGKMVPVNLVASSLLNTIFKFIFHRARPDIHRLTEATGFSFPSGHSMIGMSFYGFLIFVAYTGIKSRWRYFVVGLLAVLILMIGLSRIYLGVHYASDVIAGFSAGLAWLIVFISLTKKTYDENSAKQRN